ncbi:MAG: MarR family winged helix-turn-helix transcriptional regulator [Ruminococcus sp.]|jgi:DNA-binding MarR family transcriptional regulator
MDETLETLLYGMQFKKLLEKLLLPIENKYDLNKVDLQIMFYLYSAGSRNTSKDIMELKRFTRGHISQSLGRLQKKGYITIELDTKDRRCMHNYLTECSEDIIEQLRDVFARVREIIFTGITEEEKEVLISAVQKISRNINEVIST